MKFQTLHELIPYVKGGKEKVLRMQPYNAVTLRMPGRHAEDTEPKGGDFVVCVDDEGLDWTEHQFKHTDIFLDLEGKRAVDNNLWRFMEQYYFVIKGGDPEKIDVEKWEALPGIHPKTFLYAVQCLAVAEHRRYARYEEKFGGRYLPFRFGAGIVEGLWTAGDAIDKQRRGRPGVEQLERTKGTPDLTKDLML